MQGVRNLGMGNAGVALSHDENALFYNPAGLAGVDAVLIGFPFALEVSQDMIDLISDVSNLGTDSTTSEVIQLTLGKRSHLRTIVPTISLIIPFGNAFTFGTVIGAETQFDVSARNPVSLEMEIGLRVDALASLGLAAQLGSKNHWLFGVAGHRISRCDVPLTTLTMGQALDNATAITDNLACTALVQGTTYDIGVQRRLESSSYLRMMWGVTVKNANKLTFARAAGDTYPVDHPTQYNVGFSMQPTYGILRMLYAIDMWDITMAHPEDEYCKTNPGTDCTWKRLHMGTEFGFFPIDSGASTFALRAGFNQGYFSWGLELNPFLFFRLFTLQYAVYKVETGRQIGDRPQQRKVFQINFGF